MTAEAVDEIYIDEPMVSIPTWVRYIHALKSLLAGVEIQSETPDTATYCST